VHFNSVGFTSDQPATVLHYVVAAGDDGLVRIWDMTQDGPPVLRDDHNIRNGGRPPKEKDTKDIREFNTTRSLSFAPDGSGEFVTAGFDGTLRFHLTTGRRIEAVNAHGGRVLRVAYSPDGRRVVSAGGDESSKKYLKVWNVKDRSPFKSFDGHTSYVVAAAWSSDSRYLATGGGDRSIRIWDANTGDQIQMFAKAHSGDIESIAFVPGTTRFLSVSEDGMMKVWDIHGGELLAAAGYDDSEYLAYTPVGCYAGSDGIERRFKLTSAGRDVAINGGVRRTQFVPEGFALRR
jgi:WD40 repeat protein